MPSQLRLRAGGLIDDLVGAMNGIAQDDARAGHARLAIERPQVLPVDRLAHQVHDGFDGDAACNLARVVAAHAVGQHQQADVRIKGDRVLVVLADLARIGQADTAQLAFRSSCRAPAQKECEARHSGLRIDLLDGDLHPCILYSTSTQRLACARLLAPNGPA